MAGFEGLYKIKKGRFGNGNAMSLNLDISKARERVEWRFLLEVMRKFGYIELWKVEACITSIFIFFSSEG